MDIESLKIYNYELFLDGVNTGALDYNEIAGLIPVGAPQPNPTISSFLGGPYLPVNNVLPKTLIGTAGASGNYPRPFLSWAQRTTNANYSNIGAYARMIRYHKEYTSSCINDECGNKQSGEEMSIWGRIGIIPDGDGAGDWGFYAQRWYLTDDGTYDAAFWADRFNLDIPDKPTWWDQCSKSTYKIKFYNDPLRYDCLVEVALENVQFDDEQYYKGEPLKSFQDGSLALLPQLVGIASFIGWI